MCVRACAILRLDVAQSLFLTVTFAALSGSKEPGQQRVKRWAFGIDEVLKDPVGREQFLKFLESEFSSENLRYTIIHTRMLLYYWSIHFLLLVHYR